MARTPDYEAPVEGKPAPDFTLLDQNGDEVALDQFRGRKVLVYFYPKADTPGCTTQACGLRDINNDIGDTVILGISPDSPKKLSNFATKYELNFTLLSDPEHMVCEQYGVWVMKKNYGKEYMGVQRSAFLVDEQGMVERAWPGISPADTPTNLVAALADSTT